MIIKKDELASGERRRLEQRAGEERRTLALEGVDDVHGSDRLAAGVLSVGDGVADDVLKEGLEHGAGLLVDEARDTLHTATASETADGGLGDALDVVTQHLAVALGAALAEALAALATTRHDVEEWGERWPRKVANSLLIGARCVVRKIMRKSRL